jgi:hypothetical protein
VPAKRCYNKAYMDVYRQRPEVKARAKARAKAYYQRPEVKARKKAYNQRPEVKAYRKIYRQRPKVKAYYRCPEARVRNRAYYQRPEVKAHRKAYNKVYGQRPERKAYNKAFMKARKDELFSHYGGYVCVKCGNTDERVLTIDHVNGGGNKHRKEIGKGGYSFYLWLRQNGYPSGFQILCMNCQFIKRIENRESPK